jgi:uncharacterized membrane protein
MTYTVFKFLHLLGVVLLIGNVTITAYWKVFADRTRSAMLVAHAQRAVIYADWLFTLPGIILILVGGYGMVWQAGLDPFGTNWLIWGQVLFFMSGVIWLGILIPAQIRQAKVARSLGPESDVPLAYWRDGRLWLLWGIAATVPLIAAIYVMIVKV